MQQDTSTALVAVNPLTSHEVVILQGEIAKIHQEATAAMITTAEDLKPATDILTLIANLKKALEAKRKDFVGPLNAYLKQINDVFKTIQEPLDAADRALRAKVTAYQQEVEKQRKEAEELNRMKEEVARRERETAEKAGQPPPPPPPPPEVIPPAPKHVHSDTGTIGTVMVRKWEVVDFSQVPDDYKVIDSAKVNKVVKAGIPSIPGVRIFQEPTIRVTPN